MIAACVLFLCGLLCCRQGAWFIGSGFFALAGLAFFGGVQQ